MTTPGSGSYPPYGEPDPVSQPAPGASPYQPYPAYGGTPNPYGGNPYGGTPNPYGGSAPTDGVSIAGFVLSLLCCTGIVGLVLGIVGISRTKDGQRSGRWAAVSAIVIGVLGTLATVGVGIGIFWVGTNVVTPATADVGQCLDIDGSAGDDSVTMWKKDCDEGHDAEVVATGTFTGSSIGRYQRLGGQFCSALAAPRYQEALRSGDYIVDAVVDSFDADDPELGDDFVCFAESADGSQLQDPIAGADALSAR